MNTRNVCRLTGELCHGVNVMFNLDSELSRRREHEAEQRAASGPLLPPLRLLKVKLDIVDDLNTAELPTVFLFIPSIISLPLRLILLLLLLLECVRVCVDVCARVFAGST